MVDRRQLNTVGEEYDPFVDDVPVRSLEDAARRSYGPPDHPATPKGTLGLRRPIVPPADEAIELFDDGSMGYGPFRMTSTGLHAIRAVSQAEWVKMGRVLKKFEGAITWMIGDWFNDADAEWGVTYAAAAEFFGYEVETLYTYAWLAGAVQTSIRIEVLSPAHHRAVAGFDDVEVQRLWLNKAATEGWSLAAFKAAMFGTKTATLPADVKAYRQRQRKLDQHFSGKKTLPLPDAEHAIRDQIGYWTERLDLVRQQLAAQAGDAESAQS